MCERMKSMHDDDDNGTVATLPPPPAEIHVPLELLESAEEAHKRAIGDLTSLVVRVALKQVNEGLAALGLHPDDCIAKSHVNQHIARWAGRWAKSKFPAIIGRYNSPEFERALQDEDEESHRLDTSFLLVYRELRLNALIDTIDYKLRYVKGEGKNPTQPGLAEQEKRLVYAMEHAEDAFKWPRTLHS